MSVLGTHEQCLAAVTEGHHCVCFSVPSERNCRGTNDWKMEEWRGIRKGVDTAHGAHPRMLGPPWESLTPSRTAGVIYGSVLDMVAKQLASATPRQAGHRRGVGLESDDGQQAPAGHRTICQLKQLQLCAGPLPEHSQSLSPA